MAKIVLTEGVSQIAQTIIKTFSEAEIPLTVLVDTSVYTTDAHPYITYQPIDWLNPQEWERHLNGAEYVIFNVHSKMFNSSLWHGYRSDLRRLIGQFVRCCTPRHIIELTLKKEVPIFAEAEIYALPKSYFFSNSNVHTETASSLQAMQVRATDTPATLLKAYATYLHKVTCGLIEISDWPQQYNIYLKGTQRPLIAMHPQTMHAVEGIQLHILPEGLLTKDVSSSSMSFLFTKVSPTELQTLLYRYESALPWWLYLCTQAVIHDAVMAGFGRWLRVYRSPKD
ncbi:Uncharacterised protein [Staphylococcus piscifermentans]|uniref:Uncharacterized protein n=1 Tax=Staphylococcus piscifermentans TaxID=70258 RepID=A0A239TP95_9STAP|nr:hypothetical protein [Staphylococcus piscifermentans]RTX84521.1 hypothetical protein CD139_06280 [Staphylococcus piscifermentans]GEP84469.1 hypothetical protein SPI02_10540 [Staphylococcus piscifermentans]SNU99018.1 Uncharacterised protein [Staphylococcus piscifermentans]